MPSLGLVPLGLVLLAHGAAKASASTPRKYQVGGNETLAQEVARYVGYFQLPFYRTVLEGRPLVFVLNVANDNRTVDGITALQAATKAKLGVSCYIVYMGGANDLSKIKADAVSRYMIAENRPGGNSFEKKMAPIPPHT